MKKSIKIDEKTAKAIRERASQLEGGFETMDEAQLDRKEQELSERISRVTGDSQSGDEGLEANWQAIQARINKADNVVPLQPRTKKKQNNQMVWGSLLAIAACALLYVVSQQPADERPLYKGGEGVEFQCDVGIRTPEGDMQAEGLVYRIATGMPVFVAGSCEASVFAHIRVISAGEDISFYNLPISDSAALLREGSMLGPNSSGKLIVYITGLTIEEGTLLPSEAGAEKLAESDVAWSDVIEVERR